jgi:hypothetical protein
MLRIISNNRFLNKNTNYTELVMELASDLINDDLYGLYKSFDTDTDTNTKNKECGKVINQAQQIEQQPYLKVEGRQITYSLLKFNYQKLVVEYTDKI